MTEHRSHLYGVMGEFETPEQISGRGEESARSRLQARRLPIRRSRSKGLAHAIGFRWTAVPLHHPDWRILAAARPVLACSTGCSAISYPMNIGGRPLNSWPAFIPVTFRIDRSRRFALRRGRHAGAEQAAAAVSSGLQCGALCARFHGPLLPVHRSARSEIRSGRNVPISCRDLPREHVSEVKDEE